MTELPLRNVRILLADDHALMRSGLRSLLEGLGAHIVAELSNGTDVVRAAPTLAFDVALLDVGMPQLNGIEVVRQLRRILFEPRAIMLSMHAERQYVHESLRAGASGYVLKDAPLAELASAIRTVIDGGVHLSPAVQQHHPSEAPHRVHSKIARAVGLLTTRQREVLQLIAEGRSSTEIARLLQISARTVDTHRNTLMRKLAVRTIAGLTRVAIRYRVAPGDPSAGPR